MTKYPCENCKLRAHYDRRPKSPLGRLWRWHINFCPGWKAYFTHQDEKTKAELRGKYNLHKYQLPVSLNRTGNPMKENNQHINILQS